MRRSALGCALWTIALILQSGCSGTFTRSTALKGTVTEALEGRPLGGAAVALGGIVMTTGEDGTFCFEGLTPGDYPYQVSAPAYIGQSGNVAIRVGTNRMDFALVRLEHGEVHGRVNDQTTGEPIQGATVLLGGLEAATDAQGEFAFGGLDPGPYILEVSACGFLPWTRCLDVALERVQVAIALARQGLTGIIVFSGLVSGARDIYIMSAAGGEKTALTGSGYGNYRPALSPDGARVLFACEENDARKIRIMNRDGFETSAVTSGPADDYPSWSPDGSRIAFQSVRDGSNHIIVAAPDGSGQLDLGPGRFPTWSPDGLQIAFVTSGQVHICPASGGMATPVGPETGAYYPAWSPDGRFLTLSLKEGVDLYGLYLLSIPTGELLRLAGGKTHLRSTFSPDGRMVAFHTIGVDAPTTQIYIVASSGDGLPLWVSRSGGESQDPSWR